MMRCAPAAAVAVADAALVGLFNALSAEIVATTISAVRVAAAGSDLAFPVASAIVGNSYGTGAASAATSARELTFTGRSSDGRRARIAVFGLNFAPTDYRITTSEAAWVGTALTALAAGASTFNSIGGLKPIWNGYANVGLNDHWVKEAR